MRARVFAAAGVMTVVAACADAPPVTRDDAPATPPELAMPAAEGQGVASEIEVRQPAPEAPTPAPVAARPAEKPEPSTAPGTSTEVATPEPEAALTMPQPTVVATSAPPPAIVTEPAATHDHAPVAGPSSGPVDGSMDGTLPTNRGPMIMIRGGTGGANDPCVIHGPGGRVLLPGMGLGGIGQPGGPDEATPTIQPGDAGVMVNDRAPRMGVGGKYPAGMGATPTRSGGTRVGGMTGMGGGRMRGGIR